MENTLPENLRISTHTATCKINSNIDLTLLAEKLELVLLDPLLREKIGVNANKWVQENHSWNVISERVTEIYKQIWEE